MSDLEKRVHNLEVAMMALLTEMADNGTRSEKRIAQELAIRLWDSSGEFEGAFVDMLMKGPSDE